MFVIECVSCVLLRTDRKKETLWEAVISAQTALMNRTEKVFSDFDRFTLKRKENWNKYTVLIYFLLL